jgi:nanoRNase/pAp phosphatase (c-di-AMP/oligoRNAs hydrolase)
MLSLAREHRRALVLTHDNPDPDAVASACALAFLLHRVGGLSAHAAYGGVIGRAENKALLRVLRLPIHPLARLPHRDHDVGGPAGATSTLVTQYLRAAKLVPSPPLATALFYGIKSDTRDLGREVEGADVDCYNWLFPLVDKQALSRIEHPQVPARYFAAYHLAYERARLHGGGEAVVVDMGEVYVPEIVPEVAERLVSLEGLRWSLAAGAFQGELYLSLRLNDRRVNAGRLVREVCAPLGGSAGGHGAMAGARLPLEGRDPHAMAEQVFGMFLRACKLSEGPGEPLVPAAP